MFIKVFIAVSEDKLRWPKNCLGKRNNPAAKGRTSRQKERLTAKEGVLFTVFSLLELFFSRCIVVAVAKENLLDTLAIVSLANFQHIQML